LRRRERGRKGEREGRILLQVHNIHSRVASLLKLISPDDVMFLISHGRERGGRRDDLRKRERKFAYKIG
jgi:hypothetical protein